MFINKFMSTFITSAQIFSGMNNNLQLLYKNTLSKYRKFKSRYDKNLRTGRFNEISSRKQHLIVARLKKLYNRLLKLKWQLKLAVASGAIALSLHTAPAQAQQLGPFVQNDIKNPFRYVGTDGTNKKISFADLDNDGDIDFAMGINSGLIEYYENVGSAIEPKYVEVLPTDNPFNGISVTGQAAPELIDFDGDGDFDLVLGEFDGYFSANNGTSYYQNTDFEDNGIVGDGPNFVEITSPGSPIDGVSATKYDVKPAVVDIDGDGDLDIFLGQDGGSYGGTYFDALLFFENNGSFSSQALPSGLEDFQQPNILYNTAPTFLDYDGDSDQDLFIGGIDGTVRFFRNLDFDTDGSIGTTIAFTEEIGATNPFDGIDVGQDAVISFADIDGDGDKDAVIGQNYYSQAPRFFENTGSGFNERVGISNPFEGLDVGYEAAPTFVDLDNDGDLDAVIGGKYSFPNNGYLGYFENDGAGAFNELITGNPVSGLTTRDYQVPTFVNFDGDSDFDLFIGIDPGLDYYVNTGDENNPNFTAPGNSSVIVPSYTGLAGRYRVDFSDIDEDGDLDAVVGHENYVGEDNLEYFKNDGSNNFTLDNTNNPFAGINIIDDPVPRFVDIDHDGQEELFVALQNDSIAYFEKLGPENYSAITTPADNPLSGSNVGPLGGFQLAIDFADLDQDGDLDAFVGADDGLIRFFENQNEPPQTNGNPSSISFIEGDGPVTIEPFIAISDDTNDDIISATISILTNYVQGEDVIDVTLIGGVTGNFDATTGVYTIQGYATMAEYEAMLQSATFFNTNLENPTPNARTIEFAVTDFDNTDPFSDSFPEFQIAVQVTPVNDAPTVVTASTAIDFTEGDGPTIIDNAIVVDDVDDTNLASALVVISSNYVQGEDLLAFTDQNGITGSFNASTGELTLTGSATLADYQTALQSVTFENTSEDPGSTTRNIDFTVFDGALNSTVSSRSINIIPVNDPPEIVSNNQTPLEYTSGESAITVDDLLDISDLDDVQLQSASVTIIGSETGDNLLFTASGGVTGNFSSNVLTLTGAASLSVYRDVLQSVQFETSADTGTRTISFVVNDGSDDSQAYSRDINITGANQPPSVNTTPATTQVGSVITIDLCAIISDPDNNFDELTISVISTNSGANTVVSGCDLTIDYANTNFSGNDEIVIEACDPSGNCDQNTLNIEVQDVSQPTEVNIFNAVSPNNDGLNDFWEVQGLTQPNSIILFNRWGDEVKALNDVPSPIADIDLSDLPAATYFYRINSPEGTFEGYVVIKK